MKICLSCEGVTTTTAPRCGNCGAWLLPTESVHFPDRRGEGDSANPLLGTVVDGKYRLQSVLGRGGLGTVFQAVHIGSLMAVAVKLLHPRFAERPEYRRALLPEARRAATVANERCARLLDVGEAEDGVAYLAMELVEGETLDVLMRGGALAPARAVQILAQVAQALVAIHAAGLVHCDLSPRNVMVAVKNGTVRTKVLDFGIARPAAIAGAERVRTGEFAGFVNPAFAAPEQLAGQEVDARADLYSLGTLAWLMLAGQMPVDDADPRRAARAVVAGELRPWPAVPGVPRRLLRLVRSCLQLDRAARPASAQVVLDELSAIEAARRPALGRFAFLSVMLSAMAWMFVSIEATPPYLRFVAGSVLELSERSPTAAQHLTSRSLDTLRCHFGGFAPEQLRVDILHAGTVLATRPLRPLADPAGDICTLSVLQDEWRGVVQSLLEASRLGPVDLSFVVPGNAPLGSARVQLDDEPPQLVWSLLHAEGDVVTSRTTLRWDAKDNLGLVGVVVEVSWGSGRPYRTTLPESSGELPLGTLLARERGGVEDLGPGQVVCFAADRAGNRSPSDAVPFAHCDVAAPAVLEVTGPAAEAFVPILGGIARFRVRLSARENDCTLQITTPDLHDPIVTPMTGTGEWRSVEVRLDAGTAPLNSGPMTFAVVDAHGNRTEHQTLVTLRDRSLRLQFSGVPSGSAIRGEEIVLAQTGGMVVMHTAKTWVVSRVGLDLAPAARPAGETTGELVHFHPIEPGATQLVFGVMPVGAHRLRLGLEEVEGEAGNRVEQQAVVRVLPPAIEVRLPVARSRFLSGALSAGLLAMPPGVLVMPAPLRDGPGWRIDPELRPYVDGALWVGADGLLPVPLPAHAAGESRLLPEVLPVPGHNVFAVDLHDVLGREVAVYVGDAPAVQRSHQGHKLSVIADFWWHNGPPELLGEELLVEFGQPLRVRFHTRVPYVPADKDELHLGLPGAPDTLSASEVIADGQDGANIEFEVGFALWSVAARLADRPREAYATQIETRMPVYVETPMGRFPLDLRLRTMRSTLGAVELGDVAKLSPGLADLRLVPVLAPDGPFAEPVPDGAPPRALFRSQAAVAVRNFEDFLLQDREFTWGQARALVRLVPQLRRDHADARLVHADDPLGERRVQALELLPAPAPGNTPAADDESLCGVNFYQAYSLCRLLGLAVGGDPDLFRLPLGCELELAAFGTNAPTACNGPASAGHPVAAEAFRAAEQAWRTGRAPTAKGCEEAHDTIASGFGASFTGLDFGVREWVGDLPAGAELLLAEWMGDHERHLSWLAAFAGGTAPPRDLAAPLHTLGVVRGLALGEVEGLLAKDGTRLVLADLADIPASVPGVLRTEQLRRDGRDLLSTGSDPRLRHTGFRVAGQRKLLAILRGRR